MRGLPEPAGLAARLHSGLRAGLRAGLLAGLLAVLIGLAGGCARPAAPPPPPPPERPADPADILRLPQDVGAYFAPAALDLPVLPSAAQEVQFLRLRERHFAPWRRTQPAHAKADALWGLGQLKAGRHYGENLRPLGPEFRAQMEALSQADSYPNLVRPAIATANTSLRVLPTQRPGFLKPSQPGEGYPFDYWQNSGLLAGTPLLATHQSADGAWVLVEGRTAAGWVPARDIAFVDEAFMALWEALPLAAVTREGAPLAASFADDPQAAFLFTGRIGMLLPVADAAPDGAAGLTLLAPVRKADGHAVSLAARLAPGAAEMAPLPLTPRVFAALAGQLMGQPYGWGGYLENRDCSALLVDLFAPFGVFLPRNSSQQARQGQWTPFGGLDPQAKEALVLEQARPLLTLLHKPGHIMLYLGQRDGRAVILHDMWGLRTRDGNGKEGRFVVGRVAVTTVTPGAEIPEVARAGVLSAGFDGMTLLAPESPKP